MAPVLGAPIHAAETEQAADASSTLLVYTTTGGVLRGDFTHAATVGLLQDVLASFPAEWLVSGVGTTDWDHRNGELFPGGQAGDMPFWWADPGSPSQADTVDLRTDARGPEARFPLVALAIGDPAEAWTVNMQDVPDIHAGIRDHLAADAEFAGVQLEGAFGPIRVRLGYYLPTTGLDTQAPDFVPEEHFRFLNYAPAMWRIYGVYTAKPELQQVLYTNDQVQQGLHLHGYHAGLRQGGHILGGAADNVRATIWPVSQLVMRYGIRSPTT